MVLDAHQLAELVREIAPLVAGARVREVVGLPPRDLVLVLEKEGVVRRLRLSAEPDAARAHLVAERVPAHRGPLGPFFRRAADELAGATLLGLEQVGADRVLRLALAGREERALLAELFARHANLVLCDGGGRVLAALVPPPAGSPASARLAPGARWEPPPGRPPRRSDPPTPLAQALPDPPPAPLAERAAEAPLSRRVEHALGARARALAAARARADLVARLRRRRKGLEDKLAGLARQRAACAEAERVRRDGELVLAHARELRRGADEARLPDWHAAADGGEPPLRRVALDPRLGPRENAERLFARARKLETRAATLDAEEEELRRLARALDELLAAAEDEPWDLDALGALAERAEREGLLPPRQEPAPRRPRAAPAPRLPYRSFRGAGGSEIRVGRSAADNDRLTFRECRGNDVWLHTRDAPGSHVVLRLEGRADPDPEELLDAAHLALHFSPLRGARRAAIHVARCKEVRKPRGAPPGLVLLSGGRTLSLRVEPERLARLLGARPPAR